MIALTYRVTLLQPLLATALQGDPNSSVSCDYIPGSRMRGVLINHYIRSRKLGQEQVSTDLTCQHLFFSGAVRYLHAYPLGKQGQADHQGRRALPTPRSLLRHKHAELVDEKQNDYITAYDASHPYWNDDRRRRAEGDDALKPIGKPFCVISQSDIARFYAPPHTISVHIQRDPQQGRALRQNGQVFQYDALAAGQCFEGIVLADAGDAAKLVEGLLKEGDAAKLVEGLLREIDVCWIGRSRSANYGKVAISHIVCHEPVDDEVWREYDSEGPTYDDLPADDQRVHTMTLLSDALLRDEDGNPLTCFNAGVLAMYLGLPVDALLLDEARTFTSIEQIGGFNRAWRLPLDQDYALAAGSVIAFRLKQPLAAAQAQAIEQQGIGDRCIEGFGRLAFNLPQRLEVRACTQEVLQATPTTEETLPAPAQDLARRMARRLFDQQLDRKIVEYVNTHLIRKAVYGQMPPNSQLARVRVLVRRALPKGDAAMVLRQFNQFKATAREQFERARFLEQSLSTWIIRLLEQPERVWVELGADTPWSVAGQVANRDSADAALRLLSAVMAAPGRLRSQERGER